MYVTRHRWAIPLSRGIGRKQILTKIHANNIHMNEMVGRGVLDRDEFCVNPLVCTACLEDFVKASNALRGIKKIRFRRDLWKIYRSKY